MCLRIRGRVMSRRRAGEEEEAGAMVDERLLWMSSLVRNGG
jgi:hypothetical protein